MKRIFCRMGGPLEFKLRELGFRIAGISDCGKLVAMEGII
jgi:hypothetical protein